MAIRDILFKKEYLTGLSLIIINIFIIYSFLDFSAFKLFKRLLITSLFMMVFHYICCIFLESEININFLKIYQIQLEKVISYLSLINLFSVALNFNVGVYFYFEYLNYKILNQIHFPKKHMPNNVKLHNINLL